MPWGRPRAWSSTARIPIGGSATSLIVSCVTRTSSGGDSHSAAPADADRPDLQAIQPTLERSPAHFGGEARTEQLELVARAERGDPPPAGGAGKLHVQRV